MATAVAQASKAQISQLIRHLEAIAALPEITARITATVNDPESTAADLHKIISHDPALVSRILKLANSSMYARRFSVTSVDRAIVLLGFDAVHNLAVTATLGKLFSHTNLSRDYTARDLWMHSVAVAAASRELAKRIDTSLAEPAFLAGLVHDVGLLAELQLCPKKLEEVCEAVKDPAISFPEIERERMGYDHAQVGGALAGQWKFPDFCREAAEHHHTPWLAAPEHQLLAAIVYVADTICCQDAIGFDLTARHQNAETAGNDGLVPLDAIQYVRQNLPQLVSDAVLLLSA